MSADGDNFEERYCTNTNIRLTDHQELRRSMGTSLTYSDSKFYFVDLRAREHACQRCWALGYKKNEGGAYCSACNIWTCKKCLVLQTLICLDCTIGD